MYLKDVYGDRLTETVEVEETTDEENTGTDDSPVPVAE